MKKRSIYLALSLAMAFSAFTACGETEETNSSQSGSGNSSTPAAHEHVDDDGNNVCDGCGDVLGPVEHQHADDNGDYKCDGCGEVLEHTCVDENNDAACDICGDNDGHEHVFAGAWKSTAEGHYKDATCGHSVSTEVEAHTPANKLGQCSVCNYQLVEVNVPETVEEAVEMGASKRSLITSGSYTSVLTAEFGNEYSVNWQYGDNYTHVVYSSESTNWEGWYSVLGEVLFAIEEEYGEVSRKTEEQARSNMNGYAFDGDFAGYFADYKPNGVEGLIEFLYEEASWDENGDFAENVEDTEDGKVYSFSYGVASFYFYQVNVSFTLGEDLEINGVTISSKGYDDTQFTVTDGIATLKDGATASYVYGVTIAQSTEAPEEALVNPYDVKVLLASSFEIEVKDNNNKLVSGVTFGEDMELTANQNYKFYFKNVLPETADMTYTTVEFLIDGSTPDFFDSRAMCGFASDHSNFYIKPNKAGEYELTVIINDIEYTMTMTVLPPHPTTLSPYVCIDEGTDAWESSKTATAYEGVALKFKAMGDTEAHNASFTAEVTSGEATLTVDENGVASFTASEAGEYVVTLTSSVASAVTTTLTITVEELPDMTERLNGTYNVEFYGTLMYEVVFTPAEEGAVNGTLALVEKQQDKGTATYNYSFEAGKLVLTHVEGPEFTNITVTLDGDFNVAALNAYGGAYTVSKPGAVVVVPDISGTFQVGMVSLGAPYMYKMVVAPTEDGAATGTISITDMQSSNKGTAVYNYTIANGVLTAEYASGYEEFGLTFSLVDSAVSVTNKYDKVLDISVLEEEETVIDITGTYNLSFVGTVMYVMTIDETTISLEEKQQNKGTAVYNYTVTDGTLSTEYVSGPDTFGLTVSLDADGNVQVMNAYGNYLNIEKL